MTASEHPCLFASCRRWTRICHTRRAARTCTSTSRITSTTILWTSRGGATKASRKSFGISKMTPSARAAGSIGARLAGRTTFAITRPTIIRKHGAISAVRNESSIQKIISLRNRRFSTGMKRSSSTAARQRALTTQNTDATWVAHLSSPREHDSSPRRASTRHRTHQSDIRISGGSVGAPAGRNTEERLFLFSFHRASLHPLYANISFHTHSLFIVFVFYGIMGIICHIYTLLSPFTQFPRLNPLPLLYNRRSQATHLLQISFSYVSRFPEAWRRAARHRRRRRVEAVKGEWRWVKRRLSR